MAVNRPPGRCTQMFVSDARSRQWGRVVSRSPRGMIHTRAPGADTSTRRATSGFISTRARKSCNRCRAACGCSTLEGTSISNCAAIDAKSLAVSSRPTASASVLTNARSVASAARSEAGVDCRTHSRSWADIVARRSARGDEGGRPPITRATVSGGRGSVMISRSKPACRRTSRAKTSRPRGSCRNAPCRCRPGTGPPCRAPRLLEDLGSGMSRAVSGSDGGGASAWSGRCPFP
ncbi:hypothetical protein GCM10023196_016980 [Actinoallomurus vinaceus]|uniref:Uncharacterized protein n=1 Tax=Actinoallomurus vinaceus TaxID=1080074 RepID=A0ABP8U6U4_9ACTN